MVAIEGYVRDSAGQPLVTILVEAFKQRSFAPNPQLDRNLGSEVTDNEGYFRIDPERNTDEINSNVYIVVTDGSKEFVSVRDRHSRYKKRYSYDNQGRQVKWRSQIITNLNNVIDIVVKHVADASIIPTSLGVNPSLTICALAYRIAFHIVNTKVHNLP